MRQNSTFQSLSASFIRQQVFYREGKAPLLILSGGRIHWRGSQGPPESADMAEIAEMMGVPKSAILQDSTSLNTYQNAVNVREILNSQGVSLRVLLVTSALHMPRSLSIFKHQGIEVIAAPTDFQVTGQDLQEIQRHLYKAMFICIRYIL